MGARTEDGGQTTEDRRQRTEGRGQKTEDGRQRTEENHQGRYQHSGLAGEAEHICPATVSPAALWLRL